MNRFKFTAILILTFFLSGFSYASQTMSETVKIKNGLIKGKTEEKIRIFQGIPYAAPPVGNYRWKAPQPPADWDGIRECTAFGPACPQPRQKPDGKYSEDCLYLNVWTPAKKSGEKLPVMVWIHGGGFNFGSTSLPEYNGLNLSKKGVVVVTINYRLGPLGFLAHPLLSKESPKGVSGNYGLLDQIAALKWVKSNIAAFGGDPGNITIFGQSAGSRSVTLQLISPLSSGLFHKAIAQSGGPIIGSEYLNPDFNGNFANVSKMGEKLASILGCDKEKDTLASMRAKSADEIIKAADCKTGLFDECLFFAPVFDGYVLPKNPVTAFKTGKQHDVPVITGSTLNEGYIYFLEEKNLTLDNYILFFKKRFGSNYQNVLQKHPAFNYQDAIIAIDKIITTGANAFPARFVAESMSNKKSKGYLYQFTRLPATELAKKIKVHHGVDLAYVFGNMKKSDGYTDIDFVLSSKIMAYWVNFAKTGNPNGKGLPYWTPYDKKTEINIEFGNSIKFNRHLYKKECDFMERNYLKNLQK
ncbi:MAG: carboxylesterase family protein [Firmicutes bacterium]|nr:carboxylesterase family protein [Bacillota bacterium]